MPTKQPVALFLNSLRPLRPLRLCGKDPPTQALPDRVPPRGPLHCARYLRL